MELQRTAILYEFLAHMKFDDVVKLVQARSQHVLTCNKAAINFSNLGMISRNTIYFDNLEVDDAYILSLAFYAPDFELAVSTYQDCMTLSAVLFEPTIEIGWIERLLDSIIEDLKSY